MLNPEMEKYLACSSLLYLIEMISTGGFMILPYFYVLGAVFTLQEVWDIFPAGKDGLIFWFFFQHITNIL